MDSRGRANTTALPIDDRPEVHRPKPPISLEQDKRIREGRLPETRFDDMRMRDVLGSDVSGKDATDSSSASSADKSEEAENADPLSTSE